MAYELYTKACTRTWSLHAYVHANACLKLNGQELHCVAEILTCANNSLRAMVGRVFVLP